MCTSAGPVSLEDRGMHLERAYDPEESENGTTSSVPECVESPVTSPIVVGGKESWDSCVSQSYEAQEL